MNALTTIEQMSPEQLDFLQEKIMQRKQEMLQQRVEFLEEKTAKLEVKTSISSQELEVVKHRMDNFDLVNIDGDPQQRFNKMIRKFAAQSGITHSTAWKEFRQAYNTAYRTNLTMLIENHKMRNGIREITMPEFLKETGKLEDAIRVADKLLNKRGA